MTDNDDFVDIPIPTSKWLGLKGILKTEKIDDYAKKYIIYTIVEKFNFTAQTTEGFNPDNIPEHHILLHNLEKIKRSSSTETYADKYSKVIDALLLGDDEKKRSMKKSNGSGSESEEEEDNATGGLAAGVSKLKARVSRAVTAVRELPGKARHVALTTARAVIGNKPKAPKYMQLIAELHAHLTNSTTTGDKYNALVDMITKKTELPPLATGVYNTYTYTALPKPKLPAGWENYYGFNIATLNIAGCADPQVNNFLESITITPTKTPATDLILIQGASDKFKVSKAITEPRGPGKSYADKPTKNTITLYDSKALEILYNYTLEGKYQDKTWTASYSDKDKLVIINFDSVDRFNIPLFEQQVLDKISRYTNITRRLTAGYKLLIAGTFGEVDTDRLGKLETSLQSLAKGLDMIYPDETIKIGYTWTNSLYIITNAEFVYKTPVKVCATSNAVMGKLEYFLDDTQVTGPTGKEMQPEDVDKRDSRTSNDNSSGKKGKAKTGFAFADLLTSITNQYNALTLSQRKNIIDARKFYNKDTLKAALDAKATADKAVEEALKAAEAKAKAEADKAKAEEAEADRKKAVEDYDARSINVNGTAIIVPISITVLSNINFSLYNVKFSNSYGNKNIYALLPKQPPPTTISVNGQKCTINWTHMDADKSSKLNSSIFGTFTFTYTLGRMGAKNLQQVSGVALVSYENDSVVLHNFSDMQWEQMYVTVDIPKKTEAEPPAPAAPAVKPPAKEEAATTETVTTAETAASVTAATAAKTAAPAPPTTAAPDLIGKVLTDYSHDNIDKLNSFTPIEHPPMSTTIKITNCDVGNNNILNGNYNITWSHTLTNGECVFVFGQVIIQINTDNKYIIVVWSVADKIYGLHNKSTNKGDSFGNIPNKIVTPAKIEEGEL